jgi:hypothetical protein
VDEPDLTLELADPHELADAAAKVTLSLTSAR